MYRKLVFENSSVSEYQIISFFQQLCSAFPIFPFLAPYITKKKTAKAPIYLFIISGFLLGISNFCSNISALVMGESGETLFYSISLIFVLFGKQIFLKQRTNTSTAMVSCFITFILVFTSIVCITKDTHINIECLFAVFTNLILDSILVTITELIYIVYGSDCIEFEALVFPVSMVVSSLIIFVGGSHESIINAFSNTKFVTFISIYGIIYSISMYSLFYSIKIIGSLLTMASKIYGKVTVNILCLPKLRTSAILGDALLFILLGVYTYFSLFHKQRNDDEPVNRKDSKVVFKYVP